MNRDLVKKERKPLKKFINDIAEDQATTSGFRSIIEDEALEDYEIEIIDSEKLKAISKEQNLPNKP